MKMLLSGLLCAALSLSANDLATSNEAFAFSLYDKLAENNASNIVFSPYSIFSSLCMCLEGARNKTADEIQKVLQLDRPAKSLERSFLKLSEGLKADDLSIANGLFVAEGTFLLSNFRHKIETNYKAKVEIVDFTAPQNALKTINEWVESQTDNHIKELIHQENIGPTTKLVLTNALYFKGSFLLPFDAKKTEDAPFSSSKASLTVSMMQQTDHFLYFENDAMQLLSLPFKNSGKSALFLLPKKEKILPPFSVLSFQEWLQGLKEEYITIKLPKFMLKERFDLNNTLTEMGMTEAFSAKANFSGIDGLQDLLLSKVLHETVLSFDEYGILATAATSASINLKSSLEKTPPFLFLADHPFFFFIMDNKTKMLLFMAKVEEPLCPPP